MARQATFHGLPVTEAKTPIYIRAVEKDGGIPGDPFRCRWAEAAKRMFGGMAAFFRTVAYIEIEPGKITRFAVPQQVRSHIDNYDSTGEMPEGTYLFKPVAPGRTLAARSEENRRLHDPKRPPHKSRKLNSGIANGKPVTVYAARGNYVPSQHV